MCWFAYISTAEKAYAQLNMIYMYVVATTWCRTLIKIWMRIIYPDIQPYKQLSNFLMDYQMFDKINMKINKRQHFQRSYQKSHTTNLLSFPKCVVCGGTNTYPIRNCFGIRYTYFIRTFMIICYIHRINIVHILNFNLEKMLSIITHKVTQIYLKKKNGFSTYP